MAIRKYIGDRFTGLASDTKPINVTDGATFYETDTKRLFLLVSGTWQRVITNRVSTIATIATLVPNLETANNFFITAQAGAVVIDPPANAVVGDVITLNVRDNGVARPITFNSIFRFLTAAPPANTTVSKWLVVGAQYNGTDWIASWQTEV